MRSVRCARYGRESPPGHALGAPAEEMEPISAKGGEEMSNALMEELLSLETTTFEVADISEIELGRADAFTGCSTSGCSACATCVDT